MKTPYEILGVSQDANNQEIIKAVANAMRRRECSTSDIAKVRAILSRPSSRLAADFLFPVFPEQKEIEMIIPVLKPTEKKVDMLNLNKYDSL